MKITINKQAAISGCNPETAKSIKRFLTMANPAYQEAKKQGRWTGGIPKNLHFFAEAGSDLIFPRGAVRQVYEICKQHGENINIVDNRRELDPIKISFTGTLRPYQQKAVDDVLKRSGGVLEAPTGSGKTIMAMAVIAERKQPTLILVHTRELLNQWCERIRSFLGINAGIIGSGKLDIQPVTVGTVQTIRKHLDTLPKNFGFLIVDECHRTPSRTFTECVDAFDTKYMMGLSATPFRRDGLTRLIHLYLGETVHQVNSEHLRNIGAVLRPEIVSVETRFQYNYADDYAEMISALTCDEQRNRLIIKTLRENLNGGTALVVSDRIDHLKTLANGISEKGIAILTGKTPSKEREQIVNALAQGEVKVLFSTISLIGEGFDECGLHNLFIASPIKFQGRLTQVIGRILRPQNGKQARVFDFVDLYQPVLRSQAFKRQDYYETN